MSETVRAALPGFGRYHFLLRRLHSLAGIIPIGVFLMEHMLTNFGVVIGGADKYNHDVGMLQSLPWLHLIEWTFIFLPLAFHGGYGLYITYTGQVNVQDYPYGGNIRYVLHRVAGLVTMAFLVQHLLMFRFHALLNGQEFPAGRAASFTAGELANPWIAWFYVIGIVAAVYHFTNGFWTALITWGVTLGHQSRRKSGYIAVFFGVILSVLGLASLYWFYTHGGK